ncbi:MAG: efflux RND transporter periplasmic adaptor subunit [Chloroflexota bacterium]|nr:efflux RND transporter periplasmic adaptor subunit [Chloroflexota bacterium]
MTRVVKRTPRSILAAGATVALVSQGILACAPSNQPATVPAPAPAQQQGLPVTTAKVARETISSSVNYGGSIQPRQQVSVLPRIAGRVINLPFEVGAGVSLGDVIAEIDHTTNDAQVAQARANVASAQANLSSAQSRLSTVLAGPKPEDVAISESQVEAARIRLAQVRAGGRPEDVQSAEAAVAAARTRLEIASNGGRIEDVLAAQSQLDAANNRLAQVQAAGRPEDVRAAESALASARARLGNLQNPPPPRPEDVATAQATLDQARTRMAQTLDGGLGQGVTARPRPEDIATLQLRVERAQVAVDRAIVDRNRPQTGANALNAQQLDLAITQTQIDLQIARNDLEKAQNTGPTDWDVRLLQEAVSSAQANYDRVTKPAVPSPADVVSAQATIDQAQANLDKLRNVTPFELETAQQSVIQAQANLDKARTPDASNVAQLQSALETAIATLEKLKTPTAFEVDAAQAALTQAEAQLAARRNQYSAQDRQAADAGVAQAQAAVEQQLAALAIQEAARNEAFVTAPIEGVVSERLVSPGAVIANNAPLMTVISKEVEIALNVEELHIARFQENAPATFSVSAYPGEQFKGIVTSVFPSGDARSRTFTVKVRPEEQAERLRPGMFAQLSVVLERRENVNTIPPEAVVLRNDRPFAFVVVDNVAALRQVDLGLAEDRRVEVKNGLQTGEDIVVSGQATLRDKDPVRVITGPRAGGQASAQPGAAQPGAGQGQRPAG